MARWSVGSIYNDAFYGATVIHPSDTFSGILATAELAFPHARGGGKQRSPCARYSKRRSRPMRSWASSRSKNSYGGSGLDHTILVKIAVTAVVAKMLGGTREEIVNAVSNAWVTAMRSRLPPQAQYRLAQVVAAGDAASRGVRLALMALKGEMGYPSALTAKTWGFYEVLFKASRSNSQRPYGSYVIENVLFKDRVSHGVPRAKRGRGPRSGCTRW